MSTQKSPYRFTSSSGLCLPLQSDSASTAPITPEKPHSIPILTHYLCYTLFPQDIHKPRYPFSRLKSLLQLRQPTSRAHQIHIATTDAT
jgi:hypothetical protein